MSVLRKRPQIGASFSRFDGWSKVTGQEKYTADYYDGDFVWAGVKRSEQPHARLLEIDTEKARKLPGVLAVLTHKDVPGTNRQGIVRKDQPVLVNDKVRRYGDALALILAEEQIRPGEGPVSDRGTPGAAARRFHRGTSADGWGASGSRRQRPWQHIVGHIR